MKDNFDRSLFSFYYKNVKQKVTIITFISRFRYTLRYI
jgi:hypothetical protein